MSKELLKTMAPALFNESPVSIFIPPVDFCFESPVASFTEPLAKPVAVFKLIEPLDA